MHEPWRVFRSRLPRILFSSRTRVWSCFSSWIISGSMATVFEPLRHVRTRRVTENKIRTHVPRRNLKVCLFGYRIWQCGYRVRIRRGVHDPVTKAPDTNSVYQPIRIPDFSNIYAIRRRALCKLKIQFIDRLSHGGMFRFREWTR